MSLQMFHTPLLSLSKSVVFFPLHIGSHPLPLSLLPQTRLLHIQITLCPISSILRRISGKLILPPFLKNSGVSPCREIPAFLHPGALPFRLSLFSIVLALAVSLSLVWCIFERFLSLGIKTNIWSDSALRKFSVHDSIATPRFYTQGWHLLISRKKMYLK